jgi:HAD superfamily hydrolase (TIGR01509 family)
MNSDIELVIFDMDGVIFDTERLAISAWQAAGARHGYDIPRDVVVNTVGLSPQDAQPVFVNHFGSRFPFETILAERRRISKKQAETDGVPVKDGVREILGLLKNAGKKIAVATSTERPRTVDLLSMAGITGYFTTIVCGDEVILRKPAPDLFLAAARKTNTAPERCLVIEDSDVGIMAAKAAGMRAVFVPDMKQLDPVVGKLVDYQIESLRGLPSLISLNVSSSSHSELRNPAEFSETIDDER